MDFSFTEDQLALRDALGRFLMAEMAPEMLRELWESELGRSPTLFRSIAQQGLTGLSVPESHGGLGLGDVDWALMTQELGYYGMPDSVVDTACLGAGMLAALPEGHPAQAWLARIADGSCRVAVGHPANPLVSDAHVADLLLLPESTDGGLALHAVPGSAVRIRAQRSIDASRRLSQIGGATAFHLFVAVLSAFIAYSIADRPGIAPGLVGGMLAQNLGAGFLGGIASGFIAGYLTKFLADKIRLPINLEGLKPVLILPFLSTISVGLLMIYVVAPPVEALNNAMNAWLAGLQGANALLLGALLGGMMAFDMGGPINKAAYTFAVGLLASKQYAPMAAVMAGGMTPALGLGLATFLFKSRFDSEEREAGGPALVLGLSFITEGAIPFAAKDPLRVIPALVLGSAITGAIAMVSGVLLLVPHGGIFAVLIPGAVTNLLPYLVAIVTGTVVTTAALFVLKKPVVTT